uniref:NADH-ubiquinone oxidoreductase chain 4 n=1 Tax=Contracaecum ogmorhini sensu lato Pacific Canada TaxID=1902295 RepID=A0A1D8KW84_9BILA|nr:NADH dehydrogenase subunit 4 [Contracaecum ogmorhini sensu lato Pacific Canada]AOV63355.1 NADH dehydrogenase subunit 4 [Contracaecum ogmorhini sensu lato Pacific Canada]
MMEFFLFGLYFFFNPVYFFLFMVVFSFFMMNSFSWSGLFFFLGSFSFVLLVVMSLFILGMVLLSEKSSPLLLLSECLVFICVMFFVPANMIMLYMFFELSMFPILVMILGYGSQIEKINSAYYLIFYASFCSMPFLFVYFKSWFFFTLVYFDFNLSWEMVFLISLSFMMKFPVYFLHLWLPKAHVEAPTTASMLLAGLLLKLGTAGFMRIMGSLSFVHNNLWMVIAFLGMILASFCCIFQSDAKALAAYSSVTHMGFLLMALIFILMSGKTSGLVMMLAHGYTSTLMFYLIGEFYHVSSSRMVYYMNSFFSSGMIMALFFAVAFLSNSGTPPSLSFLSEFTAITAASNFMKFGFYILFLYFFIAFYYSIYILTSAVMGKSFVNMGVWNFGFSVPLIIMMYNVFWLSVFF